MRIFNRFLIKRLTASLFAAVLFVSAALSPHSVSALTVSGTGGTWGSGPFYVETHYSIINPTSVVLEGWFTPFFYGLALTSVSVGFDYGLTTAYGTHVTSGSMLAPGLYHSAPITAISCGTTYHYRAWAANSVTFMNGTDFTFMLPCPIVVPSVFTAPSSAGSSTATLNATVTSMGYSPSVTAGFDFGSTIAYGTHMTYGSLSTPTMYGVPVTGLACGGATYNFRAWITNSAGTAYGANRTIITLPCPATVVTTPFATGITAIGATVKGNLSSLGGWMPTIVGFDYSTTPITTTSYGTRVVVSTVTTPLIFTYPITGLAPHTTYYYRAFARNSAGTDYAFGPVFTFTTL